MGKINKAKEECKKKLFSRNLTLRPGASQAAACDTEPIASAPPVEPACDQEERGSSPEPDKMGKHQEPTLAKWDMYWKIPKYPVMILHLPNRLRGQSLAARYAQKPTAFRVKPKSGFVEVEVPVPTYKHQREDISLNYGAIVELRKRFPDDLCCGLSGGFKSASDTKDKGTMGKLTYEELYHAYNECVGQKFQTQIYEGKIMPVDMHGPINTLAIFHKMDVYLVPIFARVILRPGHVHRDVFNQMQAVKIYSEARKTTYEPRDGEESGETSDEDSSDTDTGDDDVGVTSGDESGALSASEASVKSVEREDTPELPGHDADYPATDYADTDEEDKKNVEPPFAASSSSEAKDINLSVKSADEKEDKRTALQKQLDEYGEETWKVCEWIDEDDPRTRDFFKLNFWVDEEAKSIELESMLTASEWLDVTSHPRFDHTRGEMKKYFKLSDKDLGISSTDEESGGEEKSGSEEEYTSEEGSDDNGEAA